MEYKSNSYKSRSKTKDNNMKKERIKPVAQGSLSNKKGINKFLDEMASDSKSLSTRIVSDLIIPAGKKLVADTFDEIGFAINQAIQIMLFGESRTNRRNIDRGYNYRSRGSRLSYTQYYDDGRNSYEENLRRFSRDSNGFAQVNFESIAKAKEVLETLENYLENYPWVTVGDLYDASGITDIDNGYCVYDYGWRSLKDAYVDMTRTGEWTIRFPKPMPLK